MTRTARSDAPGKSASRSGRLIAVAILLSSIALLFAGYEHFRLRIELDSIKRELTSLRKTAHALALMVRMNREALESRRGNGAGPSPAHNSAGNSGRR